MINKTSLKKRRTISVKERSKTIVTIYKWFIYRYRHTIDQFKMIDPINSSILHWFYWNFHIQSSIIFNRNHEHFCDLDPIHFQLQIKFHLNIMHIIVIFIFLKNYHHNSILYKFRNQSKISTLLVSLFFLRLDKIYPILTLFLSLSLSDKFTCVQRIWIDQTVLQRHLRREELNEQLLRSTKTPIGCSKVSWNVCET